MTVSTKWNIGDRVWSFYKWVGHKDVPCTSCNGKGGATIPGTKIHVECDACEGTGSTEAEWYSFDVWYAEIIAVCVEVRWKASDIKISYDLLGFQRTGERTGATFSATDSEIFIDKDPCIQLAKERATKLEDARVCGVDK